ncbi:AraC-like DNA-binding protein [Clavibacter michiganensis]|uniref:AraC family transcriptional regulator n=1 Tax=Clavibacter michiganensis TaxID=28447 RepID=UPI001AE74ECD|nr:helix-turn-helix domain-containing protein [Clavibacter michiganensis]MBP2457365.1 AraC-like DNA-binding protein [Clavibacter michiganensis]MDQ0409935.1 AraC-like DNA-binding protein [Clavibacter michiganensis]
MTTTLTPAGTRDPSRRPRTPHAETAASDAASLVAPSPTAASAPGSLAATASTGTSALGTGPLSLVAVAGAAVMGMAADTTAATTGGPVTADPAPEDAPTTPAASASSAAPAAPADASATPSPTPADASTAPFLRAVMSGADIDEATASFGAVLEGIRFAPDRRTNSFSYRYAVLGGERVTLRTSRIAGTQWAESPQRPEHVVTWFLEGQITVDRGSRAVTSRGQLPFLFPTGRPFQYQASATRQNCVHLDAGFLEQTATEFHHGPARPLLFEHRSVPTPETAAIWRQAVAAAAPIITDPDASPLMRLEADLSLARATLRLFPWDDVELPDELRAPRMAHIRVAVEYLHHNAHLPITPAEAAAAAGISTRVLQLALRRHHGQTPTEYLRGIRLRRVRAQLLDATPTTTTVRSVAEEWGFAHLGRFAASYAGAFGELPSETLRS